MAQFRDAKSDDTIHRHRAGIERVVERMRSQIAEPLRLAEMAESIHLSAFHFDRVFRDVTGVSAGAFQASLRVDAAKRQLIHTDASITEICFGLGFESLGSFTTRFSVSVGTSPGGFRELATWIQTQDIPQLLTDAFAAYTPAAGIDGTIVGAPTNDAFVWTGMFGKGLPSNRPASGTLRRGDGLFSLATPPDGRYSFLAAALSPVSDWRAYLESGDQLRVATNGSCRVRGSELGATPALRLRPLRRTDPPILIALPLLALGPQQSVRSVDPRRGATVGSTSAP